MRRLQDYHACQGSKHGARRFQILVLYEYHGHLGFNLVKSFEIECGVVLIYQQVSQFLPVHEKCSVCVKHNTRHRANLRHFFGTNTFRLKHTSF